MTLKSIQIALLSALFSRVIKATVNSINHRFYFLKKTLSCFFLFSSPRFLSFPNEAFSH